MEIERTTAKQMGSNPVEVLAFVDDWGQYQVRNHIEQQCLQILNNHITLSVDFEIVKITSWRGWEWSVSASVKEDWSLSDLDNIYHWSYNSRDDNLSITVDMDENQQMEQIRQRAGQAIAENVAKETRWSEQYLSISSLSLYADEDASDNAEFDYV